MHDKTVAGSKRIYFPAAFFYGMHYVKFCGLKLICRSLLDYVGNHLIGFLFYKNGDEMKNGRSIPQRVTIRYLQLILPVLLILFIFLAAAIYYVDSSKKIRQDKGSNESVFPQNMQRCSTNGWNNRAGFKEQITA